jgi:hypothetical protein
MNATILKTAVVAAALSATATAGVAVSLIDHPETSGSNPYLPSVDAPNYVIGYEVTDQRFGLDGSVDASGNPVEAMTQTFTLANPVQMESLFIAYNDFRVSGVIRLSLDLGNDGVVDFSEDIPVSGLTTGVGANPRTEPRNWLEFNLAASSLLLPAGTSSFTIAGISEEAGSTTFIFAPQYEIAPSGYADGEMTLNFSPTTGDAGFAVTGTVVPEPSVTQLGLLGFLMLFLRRRR